MVLVGLVLFAAVLSELVVVAGGRFWARRDRRRVVPWRLRCALGARLRWDYLLGSGGRDTAKRIVAWSVAHGVFLYGLIVFRCSPDP